MIFDYMTLTAVIIVTAVIAAVVRVAINKRKWRVYSAMTLHTPLSTWNPAPGRCLCPGAGCSRLNPSS